MELYGKLARLFTDADLKDGAEITLSADQAHYLKNVLRKNAGDALRLFNGRDGEFMGALKDISKKSASVTLTKKIREQPAAPAPVHLVFAPLKKDAMDFLIEKSVELGVTHLHPVLTNRTDIRKVNAGRLQAQVIESAEQCERMTIPALLPLADMKAKIAGWTGSAPVLWARERGEAPFLATQKSPSAFLVGPAGGFDEAEDGFLAAQKAVEPVSLGPAILRAETAALLCLSYAKMSGGG